MNIVPLILVLFHYIGHDLCYSVHYILHNLPCMSKHVVWVNIFVQVEGRTMKEIHF